MKTLFVILLGLAVNTVVEATPHQALAVREDIQADASPHLEVRRAVRRINVDTRIRISDKEPFCRRKTYHRDQQPKSILIGNEYGTRKQDIFSAKAGGKIRVEVTSTYILLPSGNIELSYSISLYKGRSGNTSDLDDHRRGHRGGSRLIPRNKPQDFKIRVHDEYEGGDWAEVNFSIQNLPV